MEYLSNEDEDEIFKIIYSTYSFKEFKGVPNYETELDGLSKYRKALERIESKYYSNIFDKASCLFVEIILGHYFIDGNKRLGMTTAAYFLIVNGNNFARISKEEHTKLLKSFFPRFDKIEDYTELSPLDYSYYNLAIIIASNNEISKLSHDQLKSNVKKFLTITVN